MYCFQCQETAMGKGCSVKGVCGKTPEVASLQDLLIYLLRGLAYLNREFAQNGFSTVDTDRFIAESLCITLTNTNFDPMRLEERIRQTIAIRERMKKELGMGQESVRSYTIPCAECLSWTGETREQMHEKARQVGVLTTVHEDLRSLGEILMAGLKGLAAFVVHACRQGYEDPAVYKFMQESLLDTRSGYHAQNELVKRLLQCGDKGLQILKLLDEAHTKNYGTPKATKINTQVSDNSAILVSGHDLQDLKDLLDQTEDSGIDIYTHNEMLSAHTYPALKKYPHLVGNYGSGWARQTLDFESFNGPVLVTSDCVVPPPAGSSYAGRLYTTGTVGLIGIPHIAAPQTGNPKDFSTLIRHARRCKPPTPLENRPLTGGFAHAQIDTWLDQIVRAVNSGKIRRFFIMSGCDGRAKERDYYTEFARKLPADTIILTAGCAKYRYNKLNLGTIAGLPRVWDAGQCNDIYSLVQFARKLKDRMGVPSLNDLPLTFYLSWYDQKSILILLSLLSLGVQDIHLGPTMPAFFSHNVARNLFLRWGLTEKGAPDYDLNHFLQV